MKFQNVVLLLILAVIVLRCLENPPSLTIAGASPLNRDWDGVSNLVMILKDMGYDVHVVDSWVDELFRNLVNRFYGKKCGLIIVVAPDKPMSLFDALALRYLVLNFGYNMLIADEGTVSNELLKFLGINVAILGDKTIRYRGTEIYIDTLSIVNTTLMFVESATLKISDPRCIAIDTVEDYDVATLCILRNSRLVVLGDSTPFINALLTLDRNNIETQALLNIVGFLCNEEPTNVAVLINNVGYDLRSIDIEFVAMKKGFREAFKVLIDPARVLYPVFKVFDKVRLGSIAIVVIFVMVIYIYYSTRKIVGV